MQFQSFRCRSIEEAEWTRIGMLCEGWQLGLIYPVADVIVLLFIRIA